jgi:hypothetical protein
LYNLPRTAEYCHTDCPVDRHIMNQMTSRHIIVSLPRIALGNAGPPRSRPDTPETADLNGLIEYFLWCNVLSKPQFFPARRPFVSENADGRPENNIYPTGIMISHWAEGFNHINYNCPRHELFRCPHSSFTSVAIHPHDLI